MKYGNRIPYLLQYLNMLPIGGEVLNYIRQDHAKYIHLCRYSYHNPLLLDSNNNQLTQSFHTIVVCEAYNYIRGILKKLKRNKMKHLLPTTLSRFAAW